MRKKQPCASPTLTENLGLLAGAASSILYTSCAHCHSPLLAPSWTPSVIIASPDDEVCGESTLPCRSAEFSRLHCRATAVEKCDLVDDG